MKIIFDFYKNFIVFRKIIYYFRDINIKTVLNYD